MNNPNTPFRQKIPRLRLVDRGVTTGEYLEEWLAGKRSLRASTLSSYEHHVSAYLVPYLGQVLLADLRSCHIDAMYRSIEAGNAGRQRPVSVSTLHRVHATLMSALNTAVKRGLIGVNPAATVELPRVHRSEASVWTTEEARRFLVEARADRWYLVYRLLLVAGLRRGEVLGLRWSQVDLDAAMLRIDRQLVLVDGRTVQGPPKSRSGTRTVQLDAETARLLTGQGANATGEYVFGHDGGPLDPAAVSRHFSVLCRRVGVPVIRLHDLRHTSASLGLASGESLFEVSRRLGHSSIRITADTYSHICPETSRTAVERLAATLGHQDCP